MWGSLHLNNLYPSPGSGEHRQGYFQLNKILYCMLPNTWWQYLMTVLDVNTWQQYLHRLLICVYLRTKLQSCKLNWLLIQVAFSYKSTYYTGKSHKPVHQKKHLNCLFISRREQKMSPPQLHWLDQNKTLNSLADFYRFYSWRSGTFVQINTPFLNPQETPHVPGCCVLNHPGFNTQPKFSV